MGERGRELRPIIPLAALDLDIFGEQSAAGDMGPYGGALRFEAEPGAALLVRRDPADS